MRMCSSKWIPEKIYSERPTRQGCQIFLGATYQNGKKHTKGPENIPKDGKIYQTAIKYTKIFNGKSLQSLPKLGFLVWKHAIWQPCSASVQWCKYRSEFFAILV
jgi:hypothetical protein